MMASLLALFADPIVSSVLIAVGTLVVHRYVPILEPLLSKLPGIAKTLQPIVAGTPAVVSTGHPVIDFLRQAALPDVKAMLPQLLPFLHTIAAEAVAQPPVPTPAPAEPTK